MKTIELESRLAFICEPCLGSGLNPKMSTIVGVNSYPDCQTCGGLGYVWKKADDPVQSPTPVEEKTQTFIFDMDTLSLDTLCKELQKLPDGPIERDDLINALSLSAKQIHN